DIARRFSHDNIVKTIGVCSSIPIILADFGLARCLRDLDYYNDNAGLFPHKWTAPEGFTIIDNEGNIREAGKFSTASDVWSFAVVL
ncbi:hypothetical protein PENTCL1PPCAC_21343, partial [Pristionchus entomophagus]